MSDDLSAPGDRRCRRSTSSRVRGQPRCRSGLSRATGAGVKPRADRRPPWSARPALAGAGAWAAVALSGGGPQPAAALPDTTLGYVSVDLDPSAGQKIEAFRTLRKFPAFEDAVDLGRQGRPAPRAVRLAPGRRRSARTSTTTTTSRPWLGDRAAVAAVALDEDGPQPVAGGPGQGRGRRPTSGLPRPQLAACGDADDTDTAEAEWVDRRRLGRDRRDRRTSPRRSWTAARQASLADDATYRQWLDEVGDPGIVTMYVAPEPGGAVARPGRRLRRRLAHLDGTDLDRHGGRGQRPPTARRRALDVDGLPGHGRDPPLQRRRGRARGRGRHRRARRLAGGWLGPPATWWPACPTTPRPRSPCAGRRLVGPDDRRDRCRRRGSTRPPRSSLSPCRRQTGLDLPEDVETLLGDAAVVAVGGDIDLETLANSDRRHPTSRSASR